MVSRCITQGVSLLDLVSPLRSVHHSWRLDSIQCLSSALDVVYTGFENQITIFCIKWKVLRLLRFIKNPLARIPPESLFKIPIDHLNYRSPKFPCSTMTSSGSVHCVVAELKRHDTGCELATLATTEAQSIFKQNSGPATVSKWNKVEIRVLKELPMCHRKPFLSG